jgi:C4-dicarboxylate transporter DctQ subunit
VNKLEKVWDKAEELIIGVFSLIALGLIVFEVVARYFIPSILPDWGAELTTYLMITAILIAGSPLVLRGQHIRADLFIRRFPQKLQVVTEAANLLVGLIYCAIVAKFGWDVVVFAQMLDIRSYSSLQFPLWIFYVALPLSFGLMTLRYLKRVYRFFFHFDVSQLLGNEPMHGVPQQQSRGAQD